MHDLVWGMTSRLRPRSVGAGLERASAIRSLSFGRSLSFASSQHSWPQSLGLRAQCLVLGSLVATACGPGERVSEGQHLRRSLESSGTPTTSLSTTIAADLLRTGWYPDQPLLDPRPWQAGRSVSCSTPWWMARSTPSRSCRMGFCSWPPRRTGCTASTRRPEMCSGRETWARHGAPPI